MKFVRNFLRAAGLVLAASAAGLALAASAAAQEQGARDLAGLARLNGGASHVEDRGVGLEVVLHLTQGVPWRVFTLDAPPRLVFDFRQVSFDGLDPARLDRAAGVAGIRVGLFRPGWSRMVLDLAGPFLPQGAEMRLDPDSGAARLTVRLEPAAAAAFAAASGAPEGALWSLAVPEGPRAPMRRQTGDRKLRVVLDPGHGGIDPGAQHEGHDEADLMLTFARELQEILVLSGRYEVTLTRTEDVFVPLQTRVSLARAAQADVFLSLHADALSKGRATGTTVYTLSETASDEASAQLAERHDRDDLLAGVDLSDQDDLVATVLMDMARTETAPRTDLLAENLMIAMQGSEIRMHRIPRQAARFSVLKSADIPSVLIELGFLSSARDLARLTDPAWRARMAAAIVTGLQAWRIEDQARQQLKRQ
jgi:N-acetylmuramoyl-L-alanine amidase